VDFILSRGFRRENRAKRDILSSSEIQFAGRWVSGAGEECRLGLRDLRLSSRTFVLSQELVISSARPTA
jgi:hypothetical protein